LYTWSSTSTKSNQSNQWGAESVGSFSMTGLHMHQWGVSIGRNDSQSTLSTDDQWGVSIGTDDRTTVTTGSSHNVVSRKFLSGTPNVYSKADRSTKASSKFAFNWPAWTYGEIWNSNLSDIARWIVRVHVYFSAYVYDILKLFRGVSSKFARRGKDTGLLIVRGSSQCMHVLWMYFCLLKVSSSRYIEQVGSDTFLTVLISVVGSGLESVPVVPGFIRIRSVPM
jgi:hypothetical protein